MGGIVYLAGAGAEFVGIILVASPDLFPEARRLSRWIEPRLRRVENSLRRLVGLPARRRVVYGSAAGAIGFGGSAEGIVGFNPDATLDEKVEFLLRRNEQSQREANVLTRRIDALQHETAEQLAHSQRDMEALIETRLEAERESYRPLRLLGVFALAIGLGIVTIANFAGGGQTEAVPLALLH